MAVLIEAISVVIRADALVKKFPGGWEAFKFIVPNKTLCADDEIVRVGFMNPKDVEFFINKLESAGLEFIREGDAIEIAVADQMHGLTSKCKWLEFGHVNIGGTDQSVAACRLAGSNIMQVVFPPDWKYEGSLSSNFSFTPNKHIKGLKYLRHENGLDVYLNPITGKEMYAGRTEEL